MPHVVITILGQKLCSLITHEVVQKLLCQLLVRSTSHNRCTSQNIAVSVLRHGSKEMTMPRFQEQSIIQGHHGHCFFAYIHLIHSFTKARGIFRILSIQLCSIFQRSFATPQLPNRSQHAKASTTLRKICHHKLILQLGRQQLIPAFRSIQTIGLQIILVAQKRNITQIKAGPFAGAIAQLRRYLVGFLGQIRFENMLLISHEKFLASATQPNINFMLT